MIISKTLYAVSRGLLRSNSSRFVSVVTAQGTKAEKTEKRKAPPSNKPSINQDMENYIKQNDPEDYKYLCETYIKRMHQTKTRGDHAILKEEKMSICQYLMSYEKHFSEKSILVDRAVAFKIAKNIVDNSDAKETIQGEEGYTNTMFIDANAGLCRVSDEIIKFCNQSSHIFSCYKIFEKDVNLVPVLQRAQKTYLKSNQKDNSNNIISLMNINQMVVKYLDCKLKSEHVSDFYDRILSDHPVRPWAIDQPIYTLYMTATHGAIKHFTMQCLYRNRPFSEMGKGRPEFFFIVCPKTWAGLTLGTNIEKNPIGRFIKTKNILFNILFDYQLLDVLPRKSFIPWEKNKLKVENTKQNKSTTKILSLNDEMYLIKARPKSELGILGYDSVKENDSSDDSAPSTRNLLEYFVHAITHEASSTRFLPLLDKWHPSAAFYCVKTGLVPVYMKMGDFFTSVNVEKILKIFDSLLRQNNVAMSNFGIMANLYMKGELMHGGTRHQRFDDETSLSYSDTLRSEYDE